MAIYKHEIPTMAGHSGQYLTTNGVISSWGTLASTAPGGSDTDVQYNRSGTFGGDSSFTYDSSNALMTVTNAVISNLLSLPGMTQGSVLFLNDGNVSEDPSVFSYDFSNEIFYSKLGTYLSTWGTQYEASGQNGSSSYVACGASIDVTTDNFVAGTGGTARIACGGSAVGASDGLGAPAAGGNAGMSFVSCGGFSEVSQGCTFGTQGDGGYVFISAGGAPASDSAQGFGGVIQLCGAVDSIFSSTGTISGTINDFASTNNFYGGVNFYSSVFAASFEIGTLTVDTAINFVDTVSATNLPVLLTMNRSMATAGEYAAQITFGGSAYSPNGMNFGQIYGDYNQGYTYFSYPNQFGGVGGNPNPVLTFVPASSAAVAGHIYNHVGVNCIPTDADYDLQFNSAGYGFGRQRQPAGSGSDLSDWIIFAGSPSVSQTNVSGGNLKLRSGLTTGNRATEVLLEIYPAGASGSSDNSLVEAIGASSTGTRFRYKVAKFNNVTTTGYGVPAIYGNTRFTARTAAQTVSTTAVGSVDGSFEVSANVLVTASTLHAFTVTCSYTDEGNAARTLTLQFSNLAGAMLTSIANAAGAVPYEGALLHIRAKASTNIVIASVGTFTTVTYNIESVVKQTS